MRVFLRILLCGALLIHTTSVFADIYEGRVVSVLDGDTLIALLKTNEQIKIRLAEIDAPEKSQPFGQVSKQSLSNICFGKQAIVQKVDIDRYGRTVGKVSCENINANQEQVKRGLAWAYVKYVHDKSILDLETIARNKKQGLWIDPNPIAPWEWRHKYETPLK